MSYQNQGNKNQNSQSQQNHAQQFYGQQQFQQGYTQSQAQFAGVNARQRMSGVQPNAANPGRSRYPSLPVGYYAQGWATSPYQQQITGVPVQRSGPRMYVVFDPNNFTENYNPWTASMWLKNYNIPATQQQLVPPQQKPHLAQNTPAQPVQKPPSQQQQVKPQTPAAPTTTTNTTPINSQASAPKITQSNRVKSEIFQFDSLEQFQKLRHHASPESALKQLSEIAMDLSAVNAHLFKPDSTSCLIMCNSYTTEKYKLGVGPINDAITVAANHAYMGYKVYFLHNPHHNVFLSFLRVFLERVDKYLTVFYTGHGAQIKDVSGDEKDGYDEVMVFDSGIIVDDDLAKYLNQYSNGKAHTILLTDCCHSGTIWDIPESLWKASKFPPNIMSISASEDGQTAKQTEIDASNQGVFTFNFWTLLRNQPSMTIVEAQEILNPEFRKFNQQLVMYPTRRDMLKKPIFPLMAKCH